MLNQDTEIVEYYKNHSTKQTREKFNISYYCLNKLLDSNQIPRHPQSENLKYDGNGFKKSKDAEFENLLSKMDKDEFYSYYVGHAKKLTAQHYNMSEFMVNKILDFYDLPHLTPFQAKKCCFENELGSYEEGVKKATEKQLKSIDRESVKQKIAETNIKKYGGSSPFSSPEVREKAKHTVQDKYGVDNVFQADVIKKKIRDTQERRFGGIGWASKELMDKYTDNMLQKYGVKYACMLPQCYSKHSGSNSTPNKTFLEALQKSGIECTTEFIIGKFRYDFKINNTLVEIDPSYTHNSTMGYRGYKGGLDKTYHLEKSQLAKENGFRCIHIWDWDDLTKVINLFKSKEVLYARNCEIRNVDKDSAKMFLDTHHLQGYVNDSIRIGLYSNDELVAIMTFGKPRYNKNYEYELLRYCTICNITGGAEKLFKYFIRSYSPKSVISYCDRSKFNGKVYTKLGFTSNGLPKPSKHWYNLKTKRHITDNLLRQRGFDQLFGKEYGCYGKNTSNEQLMRNFGFVEIYDCGQETFTYLNS